MKSILTPALAGLLWLAANSILAQSNSRAPFVFHAGTNGAFTFDTGVLRGVLRSGGKSAGLQSVTHTASGQRLDSSMGLLNPYRVFSRGQRYGEAAWDWPSNAQLREDGAVEVQWPATGSRPFELRSVYRWSAPAALDLETTVVARAALPAFEVFLASYFAPAFTNARVWTGNEPPRFQPARRADGEWQMFARDTAAESLIMDGRWKLPPHPVDWVLRPRFVAPVAVRRAPASGLSALLLARAGECFALSMPYEIEGHRSLYQSLFGRDLRANETATARTRLVILTGDDEPGWRRAWESFSGQ